MAGLAASFGSGAMTNSVPEISEAQCILVTGSNTTEAHPIIGTKIIKAKEKGTKLIVVDPRRIHLSHFADIHLRPRLGTDVAWINGLMYIIIDQGLHDDNFINKRTEGFKELRKKVKDYPPERVERITGIPKDDLVKVAKMYATAKNSAIYYTMGITQHTTGTDNVRSLANLVMLTGNVGKPGTGINPLRGQNNVQGSTDMGAIPNTFSGYQPVSNKAARMKFEQAWGTKLPSIPGLTIVEMINAALQGQIKGMYIMGENPMVSDPDIHHVEKGLKNLELFVVQDIFLTETARLAHVVLPGVSFAEKEGTFTGTDRRVQRIRKTIEPLGEAKPDWEIISLLAKKMGNKNFNYSSAEEIFKELARLTPQYHGMSYKRLEETSLQWPCPTPDSPGTQLLHKGTFAKGKGTFTPIDFKEADELPDKDYPFTLTTGRIMFQFHTGTMTRRSPNLDNEAKEAFVEINPKDADFIGVKNEEYIKVISRRGEIEAQAKVTERVSKGIVFIPFHFAESAANILTNPALDPIAKIPEYKVCAVNVERT